MKNLKRNSECFMLCAMNPNQVSFLTPQNVAGIYDSSSFSTEWKYPSQKAIIDSLVLLRDFLLIKNSSYLYLKNINTYLQDTLFIHPQMALKICVDSCPSERTPQHCRKLSPQSRNHNHRVDAKKVQKGGDGGNWSSGKGYHGFR